MSESWNIKQLEELLGPSLKNGEKVIGKKISALTAPGENYGSIMLRVDLDIKSESTGRERKLNVVAKLAPESEFNQAVFDTQVTYRNEFKFYAEIVPVLDTLLKTKGFSSGADFIAPCYGGRINLDGSKVVTSDAVILMKNLKPAGYTTGQKAEGFNMEVSKVVLNSLAKFHAAGIALRHLEPQTFKEKLEPYFYFYIPQDGIYNMGVNKIIEQLGDYGFSSEEINALAKYKEKEVQKTKVTNETWGTIIHYDSWTNNFLIKYEDNKPIHAVLVDFQVCDYKSPLCDVMFFLFTSVHRYIFEKSLDPLLEYYYKQLLDYLRNLGVDIKPFTQTSFENEIKFATENYEYVHTLWMLTPMLNESFQSIDDVPNLSDIVHSEKHIKKVVQLTRECFKRGWLSVK